MNLRCLQHQNRLQTAVNEFAPFATGSDVVNTARITGSGITPITISETIAAESTPILNITKSVSPVPVTENGILTYTFLIQNMGSAPAAVTTGATITDTFNPILSGLTVTFNGTAWTAPTNYTCNETTGLFATAAGQITVPAATFTQDPETGAWVTTPGVSTLVVTGTI